MVSAEGRVCTFGHGRNGCLGLNDEQDRLVPALLAAEVFEGSTIVTVAAGGYYTMAVAYRSVCRAPLRALGPRSAG